MYRLARIGWNYRHPPGDWIVRPSGSGDVLFVLFRSQVVLRGPAGTPPRRLPAGTCILFPRGAPQDYGVDDGPLVNDWFHVAMDEEDWLSLTGPLALPAGAPFAAPDPYRLSEDIRDLSLVWLAGGPLLPERLDTGIRALFLDLAAARAAHVAPQGGSAGPRPDGALAARLRSLRAEVLGDFTHGWSVPEMAERIRISPSRLATVYRSLFGTTPMQDVIGARLRFAGYLLRETGHPVADVARQSGYDTVEHFMRQFRRSTGMTPTAYRKARPTDSDA